MRVLIGCEHSGVVRDAFRARGHDAWSCDLLPAEGRHYQCDVLDVIEADWAKRKGGWDLFIVHPDCTNLCSSGLHWNGRRPGRAELTERDLKFVRLLLDSNIPKICLENPTGCISTRIRPYDQRIQPYEFGHDASKGTCLWLKGLRPLIRDPEDYVKPRRVCKCGTVYRREFHCPGCGASVSFSKPRWANQTDSGQNKLTPSKDRWKERARTYEGIAKAMASQWGV